MKLVTELIVNRDCMVNSIFKRSKTWHLFTLFNVHSVLYFCINFIAYHQLVAFCVMKFVFEMKYYC